MSCESRCSFSSSRTLSMRWLRLLVAQARVLFIMASRYQPNKMTYIKVILIEFISERFIEDYDSWVHPTICLNRHAWGLCNPKFYLFQAAYLRQWTYGSCRLGLYSFFLERANKDLPKGGQVSFRITFYDFLSNRNFFFALFFIKRYRLPQNLRWDVSLVGSALSWEIPVLFCKFN